MAAGECYLAAMFLIVVIASDVHTAEYADYDGAGAGAGTGSLDPDGHSVRDLYNALQQSDDHNGAKLWNIPLQHLMVRKSLRSPSLRLRFGRRSDPLLANDLSAAFLNQDTQVERKSVRSPSYRLRFGRRSDPELSDDFMARKASRSPSFRLRFGRRSDPLLTHDFSSSYDLGDDYLDKKVARSPSYRLRFGRQSDFSSAGPSSTEDLAGSPEATEMNKGPGSEGVEDN